MYLGLESVVKVKVSPTSEKSPPAKLSETDEMLENALSFSVNVRAPLVPLVIKISVMIWLLVISSARSWLNVLADDPARFVKARKVIAAERSRKDRRSNAHSLIDPCAIAPIDRYPQNSNPATALPFRPYSSAGKSSCGLEGLFPGQSSAKSRVGGDRRRRRAA